MITNIKPAYRETVTSFRKLSVTDVSIDGPTKSFIHFIVISGSLLHINGETVAMIGVQRVIFFVAYIHLF